MRSCHPLFQWLGSLTLINRQLLRCCAMINALCSFFGPFGEGDLLFHKWVPSFNDESLSMMGNSSWHHLLLRSSFPVWVWVLTGWGERYLVIKMTCQVWSMTLWNLFCVLLEPGSTRMLRVLGLKERIGVLELLHATATIKDWLLLETSEHYYWL